MTKPPLDNENITLRIYSNIIAREDFESVYFYENTGSYSRSNKNLKTMKIIKSFD